MRYIKVWSNISEVPLNLLEDVVPLLGSYFQQEDVVEVLDVTYGEGTWNNLAEDEQLDILTCADKGFEAVALDNWDEIVLDSIPVAIRARLGDPLDG